MTDKRLSDTLRRDDMKPFTDLTPFERLSRETQTILRRAASRGRANSTCAVFVEVMDKVGSEWLMVPTKSGKQMVVVEAVRAFRL